MKTKYLFLGLAALSLASCDDYLDKLPDDRATLDTKEKITQLLTSAYPSNHVAVMAEISSDNVGNNGNSYGVNQLVDELYQFKDVKSTAGNDCPYNVWNGYYTSVATANEAIEAIKEYGDSAALAPQLAEAKLCRAYSMMQLASVFCMALTRRRPTSISVWLIRWSRRRASTTPISVVRFASSMPTSIAILRRLSPLSMMVSTPCLSITGTLRLHTLSLLVSTCIT